MAEKSAVWHPYTQMKEWDRFTSISRGDGIWLVDSRGNRMLDGVASMWCNVWGHSKKEIISAMTKQASRIPHSSTFNLTHEQAERLAKRLVAISPGMRRVFYSDNGSTAMEIAFKMAIQYWQNTGEGSKTMFATLQNGYHGDTFGTMSVGYVPGFFSRFKKNMYKAFQIPFSNSYRIPKNMKIEDYYEQTLERIERLLAKNDKIAAFVMESGAQLAGGVNIYQDGFQAKVSRICRRQGTLLILDEIATGFGRLGSLVEYVSQKSTPDLVAYGKMLTAGYLPMAVTLASKKIYDSFLGRYDEKKHLYHGHTFTANPLACAVANENLRQYSKSGLIGKVRKASKTLDRELDKIRGKNIVGDVRNRGLLAGIELVSDRKRKTPLTFSQSTNKVVFEEAKKRGLYLRTLGNTIMLIPPLAISEKETRLMVDRTAQTIDAVANRIK